VAGRSSNGVKDNILRNDAILDGTVRQRVPVVVEPRMV
jgi:hypothetical protein